MCNLLDIYHGMECTKEKKKKTWTSHCILDRAPPKNNNNKNVNILGHKFAYNFTYAQYSDPSILWPPMSQWKCGLILQVVLK